MRLLLGLAMLLALAACRPTARQPQEQVDHIILGINDLQKGIEQFDDFFERYSFHNHLLWERYAKGQIKQDELRWKRMYCKMSLKWHFLFPTKTLLSFTVPLDFLR